MGKQILIAGGAGYIGSMLVPALRARGHAVSVVDLLWFGNHLGMNIDAKDLFTLATSDLADFETVIFLAGLSNDPMADYSPAHNFIANTSGPAFLAYTAKKAGVKRFIHGGSCSIYGHVEGKPLDEKSPTHCEYPYGMSKLYGEWTVASMADDNYSVIGLRKGTVSGYSPRMRFDLLLNKMTLDATKKGIITINDPNAKRPFLSIGDAVKAYIAAVEAPYWLSGVFNAASGNTSVLNAALEVRQYILNRTHMDTSIKNLHQEDPRSYTANSKKIEETLDIKLNDSLRDIIHDVFMHIEDFKNPYGAEHNNIAKFKSLEPAHKQGSNCSRSSETETGSTSLTQSG